MKRRRPKIQTPEKQDAFFVATPEHANPEVEQNFFQAKLEIDPADCPAEKEADAVAKQVVLKPGNKQSPQAALQRKKIQKQGEEEEAAAKHIQKQEEEEAAAKHIQKQEEEEAAAKLIQKQEEEEEEAAKQIQKQEEEESAAKLIQRKNNKEQQEDMKEGANLEQMIEQHKGQGMALPDDIRQEMEMEFGADFSRVRIHTGSAAIEMCQMIQAHAFTHGFDIFFNKDRFDPDSSNGKELLAHELTHVVQQKGK